MAGGIGYTSEEYYQHMQQLLPSGPAWELDDSTFFMELLKIASLEFARIDADIVKLINETHAQTASATLQEWFDTWGIPDECLKALTDASLEDYRNVLVNKIATLGFTFGELVELIATSLGYQGVSIETFPPLLVTSKVNNRAYDYDWKHYFMTVTIDATNTQYLRANSRTSARLAVWSDQLFECLIKSLAPCHTNILFQYGD